MSWVLSLREDELDSGAHRVLAILANHAHSDGRNAFRATKSLGTQLGISQRTVQRRLAHLREAGFIAYGDQELTGHLPIDKRPQVYDLAMRTPGRQRETLPVEVVEEQSTTVDNRGDRTVTPAGGGVTTGVATGVTTGVAHRRTVSKNRNRDSYVTRSPERDAGLSTPVDCPRCHRPLSFDRNGPHCRKCAALGIDPLNRPECDCGQPLPRGWLYGEKCATCRAEQLAPASPADESIN